MKISKSFIELNLGLLFLSTSGIFGKMIELSPELAIFYRCVIAAIILFFFVKFYGSKIKLSDKSDFKYILLGGGLLAVHWVTYFYSLQLSNIAIAMLTLYTFPAMTSILEPLILKSKFHLYHLGLAALILVGIWIMLPEVNFKNTTTLAIIFGVSSALAYSLRNIWTRKILTNYDSTALMMFQVVIVSFLLTPYVFMHSSKTFLTDWPFLLGLALVTTVLGHTLFVKSMKYFSAVTVSLISSIIPIYGIFWGIVFINDIPDTKTIIGGAFILLSFIIETVVSNKR